MSAAFGAEPLSAFEGFERLPTIYASRNFPHLCNNFWFHHLQGGFQFLLPGGNYGGFVSLRELRMERITSGITALIGTVLRSHPLRVEIKLAMGTTFLR